MGFNYNHGVMTPMKGVVIADISIAIGATGAVGAIQQCAAGFFTVVRVSAGLYRFTIVGSSAGRPAADMKIFPKVASQTAANSAREAFYVANSYNPSTGVFDVQVTDRAATPAAADPFNGDELQVSCSFKRWTTS